MRCDYEDAITKLRDDHLSEATRMQSVIDTQDQVISELKSENAEIRVDANARVSAAVRDNDIMNTNLQDAIRKAEIVDTEAKRYAAQSEDTREAMEKEIRILRQELNLLEQEHVKALHKDKKQ